ncbi:L,D-transpeptidase [Kocuria marina]|uniref:L,D-transpeptidase n=1 Tax=Kocuria marina TaxID=223184 RepID=UPI0011A41A7B|nr:Ig-like domain-containing protein [Kocuria indica]
MTSSSRHRDSLPGTPRDTARTAGASARRRRPVIACLALAGLLGLSACAAGNDAAPAAPSSAASSSADAAASGSAPSTPSGAVRVEVSPGADASMVNPVDAVVVTAHGGELTDVTVSAASSGERVGGELAEGGHEWRSNAPLAFDETYTVDYTARAGDQDSTGQSVFTTVDAAHEADVALNVKDGQTYGVWQVVEFNFSEPVVNKDEVEKAVTVDGAHRNGAFRWYSDRKLRFRPEQPWDPNAQVKVTANILGKDLGNGMIGNGNKTVSFRTGPEQRAFVDNNTKTLVAYVNGKETGRWPVTLGNPDWPSTTGKKVIIEQAASYAFKASSLNLKPGDPHYYPPFDASNVSRLTWSGEFIHQALPSAMPVLGVTNVSHGCVGMPPEGAAYIFETFRPGDMVEVVNTDYPQADPDDGYGDWNIPFGHYSDEDWHGNW